MRTVAIAIITTTVVINAACNARTPAEDGFQQLLPQACVPLASSKVTVALSAAWEPYLSATRACPLAKQQGTQPEITLITIFAVDYYRDKPEGAVWENFPDPILVNRAGARVGTLEHLFPDEAPGEMTLSYGRWRGNIPGEIRIHITHSGVSGDYDLPTRLWSEERKRYVPQITPHVSGLERLLPDSCVPLASAKLHIVLGPEWQPYRSATQVCPLGRPGTAKANIHLVTVFPEDYYRDTPAKTRKEVFPKPILLNRKGERVGELAAVFPGEDNRQLLLIYGGWQGDIPGEISARIVHQGAGGGNDLPRLVWDKESRRYVAPKN